MKNEGTAIYPQSGTIIWETDPIGGTVRHITSEGEATIIYKGLPPPIPLENGAFFTVPFSVSEPASQPATAGGMGNIYTYSQPTMEMTRVEKLEAYLSWRNRDDFYISNYETWAAIKFNGYDPSGEPKVPYDTLIKWQRYEKTHR